MLTTRRRFLIGGVQVTAAVPLFGALGRGLEPLAAKHDRALVVLQLSGGNDGLNTVVPFRQDAYYHLRPMLGLARKSLHRLDDEVGLHPAMRGLSELFAEGKVACVQGVGYPSPDRSHFRSMEIWHTADPVDPPEDVGWLGRLADRFIGEAQSEMVALHVGDGDLPLSLSGRDYQAASVRDPSGFQLKPNEEGFAEGRARLLGAGPASGELAFLRQAARTSYLAADRMASMSEEASPVDYPGSDLARRLQLVARLIAGGFGTRIFCVELGGFDTHARQAPVHEDRLRTLSTSLLAFQRDLERSGIAEHVSTLVFSEFGRRAKENGSRGTDHGAAAPLFVVGSAVRGGLYGTHPDLDRLVDGDVPHTTDFRSVYAALEGSWMGSKPGTSLEPLELF